MSVSWNGTETFRQHGKLMENSSHSILNKHQLPNGFWSVFIEKSLSHAIATFQWIPIKNRLEVDVYLGSNGLNSPSTFHVGGMFLFHFMTPTYLDLGDMWTFLPKTLICGKPKCINPLFEFFKVFAGICCSPESFTKVLKRFPLIMNNNSLKYILYKMIKEIYFEIINNYRCDSKILKFKIKKYWIETIIFNSILTFYFSEKIWLS